MDHPPTPSTSIERAFFKAGRSTFLHDNFSSLDGVHRSPNITLTLLDNQYLFHDNYHVP
jgi:hypothetical protein